MRSTTRLIAALPGAVLVDKYGCTWHVGVNGAAVRHHTGVARVWQRRDYDIAQREYGPFRLHADLARFLASGWM